MLLLSFADQTDSVLRSAEMAGRGLLPFCGALRPGSGETVSSQRLMAFLRPIVTAPHSSIL
jgi:hypothetical protein